MEIIIKDVKCPECGAEEMHPDGDKILIRAFKVNVGRGWESQCLVCSGAYDKDLNETPNNWDRDKGWFI